MISEEVRRKRERRLVEGDISKVMGPSVADAEKPIEKGGNEGFSGVGTRKVIVRWILYAEEWICEEER